jgi:hypothetical protein
MNTATAFVAVPKPPATAMPPAVFIPTCIAGWTVYLVVRVQRNPELREQWGLAPSANALPLLGVLGPVMVVLVLAGAAFASTRGRPLLPPWLWLSLLVYPLWGLVQQWLVQALLVDNLRELHGLGVSALMLVGAIGFGVVHIQHPLLVLATAALGAFYVFLFQRWRNLWPLAVCHGWLGSLFYPWVLGKNPMAELVGLVTG